jgi:hypothetical protein
MEKQKGAARPVSKSPARTMKLNPDSVKDLAPSARMGTNVKGGIPRLTGSGGRFLDGARARHGVRIDMMLPVFDEMDREAALVSRRERVLDGDHRFLLALLINLPDRESILSMVRERYSGDPEQLVMKWISELSGTDVLGIDVDPLNASILRCLIAGLSFEATCDRLRQEYSSEEIAAPRDDLERHCERIKGLAAFRTLLNVEPAA